MTNLRSIKLGLTSCTLVFAAFVAGCATAETSVSNSAGNTGATEQPANSDAVNVDELVPATMVAQVQALSDEIRTLRDQVEILEIELDDTRQRQKDLYNDLDARLRKFERTAPAQVTPASDDATEPTPEASSVDSESPESVETPSDTEVVEAIEEQPAAEPVDPEVVREVYDNAFRTLKQGKYEDAIIEFTALIQNYPQSELVDDALYWIAEANHVIKRFDIALLGFEQVIRDYPDSRRAAESMLKLGYLFYDRQDFEQAQNYLLEVIDRYPASRSAFSAQRRLDKMERDGNL